MLRNFRHSIRRLARRPGYTILAVLTLALGVGAASAIFGVIDAVLLKPLAYPDSERLVAVGHRWRDGAAGLSSGSFLVYRDQSRTLKQIGAYVPLSANLAGQSRPERVAAARIDVGVLPTLGVEPMVGRAFSPEDDQPGAPDVALISHGLWTRLFGGRLDAIGQMIRVDGTLRQIVGVMPADFRFPQESTVLWIPLQLDPAQARAVNFYLMAVARLADGATIAQASEELDGLFPRSVELYPSPLTIEQFRDIGMHPTVESLKERVVGDVGEVFWVVFGAVGLVLLIACANVANLFLVQAEGRKREVALRAVVGAGRGDLMRHYLSESTLLGIAGGIAGLALAYGGLRALLTTAQDHLPRAGEIGIDADVALFAAAVSVFAGLVCGALPVLRLRSADNHMDLLRMAGSGSDAGAERHRARSLLVVCQLALALMLLAGSGLMLRTFWNLRSVELGFDPEHLLTFRLDLPRADYPTFGRAAAFHQQVLDRLAALPGVESATAAYSRLPLQESEGGPSPVWLEEFPPPSGELPDSHLLKSVFPGYFATLKIPLIAGRVLDRRDLEEGTGAVVVSRSLAERYWKGRQALSKRLKLLPEGPWYTIVGVVEDVRDSGLQFPPEGIVYWAVRGPQRTAFSPAHTQNYAVRTVAAPLSMLATVREEIFKLDPNLPMAEVRTMDQVVSRSMAQTSFTMLLLGIASVMALCLGTVGIYGVMSYVVGQRKGEIGIRMALGARARTVLAMVLSQGARVIVLGLVLGLAGALAVTRFLQSLLYGVEPFDPLTFLGVSLLLTAVALAACFFPARRAAVQDPMKALRFE